MLPDTNLHPIFDELNQQHFKGELPLPHLVWNPRLSSTAGRFCPGSRAFFRPRPPIIEVATYLSELPDGAMHVRDTVLHEMIHYYLWHRNRPHGHTAEFHAIMRKVGAKRYNPVPKERAALHWYECPNCKHGFPTRRRLGISACAKCCGKFARGQYDERFRLVRHAPRLQKPEPASVAACAPAAGNSFSPPAPPPEARLPEPRLTPAEIIRRLEELKLLVRPRS